MSSHFHSRTCVTKQNINPNWIHLIRLSKVHVRTKPSHWESWFFMPHSCAPPFSRILSRPESTKVLKDILSSRSEKQSDRDSSDIGFLPSSVWESTISLVASYTALGVSLNLKSPSITSRDPAVSGKSQKLYHHRSQNCINLKLATELLPKNQPSALCCNVDGMMQYIYNLPHAFICIMAIVNHDRGPGTY